VEKCLQEQLRYRKENVDPLEETADTLEEEQE
jgi:hypothetical protein